MTNTAALADNSASRKEALRKAGQEYFDRVLVHAHQGHNPLKAITGRARNKPDNEAYEDVEVVDQLMSGSRLYILCGLWLSGSVSQLLLLMMRSASAMMASCAALHIVNNVSNMLHAEKARREMQAALSGLLDPSFLLNVLFLPTAIVRWMLSASHIT